MALYRGKTTTTTDKIATLNEGATTATTNGIGKLYRGITTTTTQLVFSKDTTKIYAIGSWTKNSATTYGFFEINPATAVVTLRQEWASYNNTISLASHNGRIYGAEKYGTNLVRTTLFNANGDGNFSYQRQNITRGLRDAVIFSNGSTLYILIQRDSGDSVGNSRYQIYNGLTGSRISNILLAGQDRGSKGYVFIDIAFANNTYYAVVQENSYNYDESHRQQRDSVTSAIKFVSFTFSSNSFTFTDISGSNSHIDFGSNIDFVADKMYITQNSYTTWNTINTGTGVINGLNNIDIPSANSAYPDLSIREFAGI